MLHFIHKFKQRGFAIGIVTLLLFIAALFIAVAMRVVSTTASDTAGRSDYVEALYLAESALDRATFLLNTNNNTCTTAALASGPFTLGRGTYEVISATLNVTCAVKVRGIVNQSNYSVQRVLLGTFQKTGTGFYLKYLEQFPTSITGWTPTANANGTATFSPSVNCSATACPQTNLTSGSLALTLGNANNITYSGYVERTLPSTIVTGATGVTITFSAAYRSDFDLAANISQFRVGAFELFDSAGNFTQALSPIVNLSRNTPQPWVNTGNILVPLPANRNFDRVRINFSIHRTNGNRYVALFLDDISVLVPGEWRIVTWQELDQ